MHCLDIKSSGRQRIIRISLLSTMLYLTMPLMHARRSIFRPVDPYTPKLVTRWHDGEKSYTLVDSNLKAAPLFKTFDNEHFVKNMIPLGPINFRHGHDKKVTGGKLGKLADNLLAEVKAGKKKFTHFTPLKVRDYSYNDQSGLLIFKYKEYPFVLKLFLETPESFVRPYDKGFEPICFFVLGGCMRHLTGFTRIKNLNMIKKKIQNHPIWRMRVDLPRKWFWQPKDNRYFEAKTYHVGNKKEQRVAFPSVYGVIADAIEQAENFTLLNKEHRKFAMELVRYLEFNLDPHLKNFMIEKETGKILIIDTEFFPLLVGLRKKMNVRNYPEWYFELMKKFLSNRLTESKKYKRQQQLLDCPSVYSLT